MEHNSYDGTPSRRREVCQSKDKKRLHCENCDRSFASEKALKYHSIQAHAKSIKQHICNKCDKQFKSDKTLKRHILCLHENSSLHECYICMEIFTRKDNLKRHKADVHQLSNFNHNYALNTDTIKQLVYPYKCQLCDQRFKRKENLKQHQNLAACVKSHTCKICHKSFTNCAQQRKGC